MSGLCGWYSREPGALPIGQMAAPLWRFDHAPLRSATHSAGSVALAGGMDCARLYQEDGLIVAMWGEQGEYLARLWRSHGPKACAALTGAFAFAILDERKGEALLAVDRCGSRPLCYQLLGETLVFATSADALVQHPGVCRQVDPQAVYNYLYHHVVPGPGSIYQRQQRLQPGEYVHLVDGRIERGSYWNIRFHEQATLAFPQLKHEFIDTLRSAVRSSMGQHTVGAFLSGGTDSSTITAMLGQVSGSPARTYSIGFDASGYDELDYARLVARHFNAIHHERYVTPADVADAIPLVAAAFDQPFGNASAVPAFYCAQMARADGVVRLLGGDGGDELFGGNERYARQALFSRYERVPSSVRQILIEPLLFQATRGVRHRLLNKARSYIEQALVPMPARLETYNLLNSYGSDSVLEPAFLAQVDPDKPLAAMSEMYARAHGYSQVNQMLAFDMKYTLADNDLPKVNRACEMAGVDVAFPFLNDAVVAFAARLTPAQKLKGTRLRHFFKEALRDTLPREVINKKKHGFGLPFGHWLQTDTRLRAIAFDSLSDLKARRIVRADFIDTLLSTRVAEHPAYHGTMVWVLMMLEQWFAQRAAAGTLAISFGRNTDVRTARQ